MSLKLITDASEEPVTLAEAKLQCKEDLTANDTLITELIKTARQQAEHRTGRALINQTWELILDAFPPGDIELAKVPAASITSIKYLDGASVEQTIDPANYGLDNYGIRHWVIPAAGYSWPAMLAAANAVKVRFVAGYGAAAAVPSSIKAWIKMAVATMYTQREGIITGAIVAEVPRDFCDGLLDPYRVVRFG